MSWRNDPHTVRFSHSARGVEPGEHRRWLRECIADQSAHLWIAEEGGRPVGQVRADLVADSWRVDIAIDPGDRGRGLAVELLRGLQKEMPSIAPSGVLRAEVHRRNIPSMRAFASAGFVRGNRSKEFVTFGWEW